MERWRRRIQSLHRGVGANRTSEPRSGFTPTFCHSPLGKA